MVSPGAGGAGRGGEPPLEPGGSAGIGACHFVQRLGGAGPGGAFSAEFLGPSRAFPDLALPRTFKTVSELTLSSVRKGSVASP